MAILGIFIPTRLVVIVEIVAVTDMDNVIIVSYTVGMEILVLGGSVLYDVNYLMVWLDIDDMVLSELIGFRLKELLAQIDAEGRLMIAGMRVMWNCPAVHASAYRIFSPSLSAGCSKGFLTGDCLWTFRGLREHSEWIMCGSAATQDCSHRTYF